MGALGLWFWGNVEESKKKVLINEVANLYKINPEIAKKGFDLIEREAKKIHLPSQTED